MAAGNGAPVELEYDPNTDIVIKYNGGNSIRLVGPMNNKIHCLGMLALATDAVKNFGNPNVGPTPTQVVQAPAAALNALPEPDFQTGKRSR